MSRLSQYKKKEMTQKATFLFVVFIVLSILFFTFGFKLVIQSSIFLNNIFSKETVQEEQQSDDFFGVLDVDPVPNATNSAKIIVSGSTNNYPKIAIYINSKKVSETNVERSGTFSEEVGDLKKGENSVYVRAIAEKEKKSKKSDTYQVTYLSDKPKLEVTEPSDNSTTNKQEIKVAGTTDKDVSISVNNAPVVVDINGKFQTTVRLKDGENKLEIIAEDIAGNQEKKTITVVYKKDD